MAGKVMVTDLSTCYGYGKGKKTFYIIITVRGGNIILDKNKEPTGVAGITVSINFGPPGTRKTEKIVNLSFVEGNRRSGELIDGASRISNLIVNHNTFRYTEASKRDFGNRYYAEEIEKTFFKHALFLISQYTCT